MLNSENLNISFTIILAHNMIESFDGTKRYSV